MELIIEPPKMVLYVCLGLILVILASMLLKRGGGRKKILSLMITLVVMTVVLTLLYRRTTLTVDSRGIQSTVYGKITFDWQEVQEASYIKDFTSSDYGLKTKLNGVGVPGLQAGRYLLKNGSKARVIVQDQKDALLFVLPDDLILLAPQELEALTAEVEKYITLRGAGE
ncbi:MAG: hypothetical protein JW760_00700 [Spirochaetales bacterium]|nr:hypothetical protein [Spirochaetales bacterium]